MISKLIDTCINHRMLVLLSGVVVVAAGLWSMRRIHIDAIPDLSDVQVVIRTEYPGQAPGIVEDQVTYPLTTAMLAVPHAKVVRGYSMFGSSFVYIIFEDGTDIYWARSRVLEQLSFVAGALPANVKPQLGPDATGVGWVFEYVLTTGQYCPKHPEGLWHDPVDNKWYTDSAKEVKGAKALDKIVLQRLKHQRIFPGQYAVWFDRSTGKQYESLDVAPVKVRSRLEEVVLDKGYDRCPLDGSALRDSEQDLSDLRGLQDWFLRYELTAVKGVSEVAPIGGFVKQYQIVVDPVKLLAYKLPLQKVRHAIMRSNMDVGGRLIEMSENEYMVRGLGYLGSVDDREAAKAQSDGVSLENMRTARVLAELRKVALGSNEEGVPIYLKDVADIRVGPDIRRGIAEWNGRGEVVGGIVIQRFGENARLTIQNVRKKLGDLEKALPPGVAIEVAYDRSDLINRSVDTLTFTLFEEMAIVAIVIILFLIHARSAFVAILVLPLGVLISLTAMHFVGINANIMSLGGIAIAIGVMVDSSVVMVENAHKHLQHHQLKYGDAHVAAARPQIIAEAAREVGPSLFFALLIITVSFLPVFALAEQSGRLFKPLAWTKTFAMGAAAILSITAIPVLMVYFVRQNMLPSAWPPWLRWLCLALGVTVPAVALALAPLGDWSDYRWWLVGGWALVAFTVLVPQKIAREERLPISRFMLWLFRPFFVIVMRMRWFVVGAVVLAIVYSGLTMLQIGYGDQMARRYPVLSAFLPRFGHEFMPPLEEGDILYMPTTDPGISMTKARELLQQTDKLLRRFPEVEQVFGKMGRAETATDPAPLGMVETTITLKRDKSQWRQVPREGIIAPLVFGSTRPITLKELIYGYTLPNLKGKSIKVPGMNDAIQYPGISNLWTMPIKTRIEMLATGIRTPVGVKIMGDDLTVLADLSARLANALKTDPQTVDYTVSAYAEKSVGGNYLDIKIDRDEIARYGLTIGDVQDVIMSAMGGMNISYTVEGLERYPISLRYPHELRDNIPALKQTLVATPSGAQVPLGQLSQFKIHKGPPMIKSENARRTSWVYVDIKDIDIGGYVARAKRVVAEKVNLPAGYSIVWSGKYESMQTANRRLMLIVPLTLILIVVLLYLATHSWLRVFLVLMVIPLSLIGSFWLIDALEFNMSVAVYVGMIALAGLEVETALVMLLYLDLSYEKFVKENRMNGPADLLQSVYEGAVQRVRPITMTELTTFIALVPLLWSQGAGAQTMQRLAAPMVGGVATGYIAILFVLPVLYYAARRVTMGSKAKQQGVASAEVPVV